MNLNHEWTSKDIHTLKLAFLEGLPIKQIAKHLKRTPTALNKALTRFGIRPKGIKSRKSFLNWAETSQALISRVSPSSKRKKSKSVDSEWVPFSTILNYLKENGDSIKTIHHEGDHADEQRFLIHGRIYTPLQLLLRANKNRKLENAEPFLVEGITW